MDVAKNALLEEVIFPLLLLLLPLVLMDVFLLAGAELQTVLG